MRQFDQEIVNTIFNAGYTFRFASRAGGRIPADEMIKCELISRSSGRTDYTVYGPTHEEAIKAAAAKASEVDASLSRDDQAAVLAEKERMIEDLRRQIDGKNSNDEAPEDTEADEIASRAAGDLDKDQIIALLEQGGVEYDKRLGRDKLAQIALDRDLL